MKEANVSGFECSHRIAWSPFLSTTKYMQQNAPIASNCSFIFALSQREVGGVIAALLTKSSYQSV